MNSYFSHDSNARNSEKLLAVRMTHGAAGYGVYFMLLERLRTETDYTSVKDYNMIAFDLRVSSQLIKAIVEDFGLFAFTEDGKRFYSEGFSRRMSIKDETKRKLSVAGRKGMEKRWGDINDLQESNKEVIATLKKLDNEDITRLQISDNNKRKEKEKKDDDGGSPPASPSGNFFKKNTDSVKVAFSAAKISDEAAEYSEAIKLAGKDPKTLQNAQNENLRQKLFCAADYSKPVSQLLDICLRDEGYLDVVMQKLEEEQIHRSRGQLVEELKRFPAHLKRHGEDTPQRMARFKSHFSYYIVKKWKSEQNNIQQHGEKERMVGNDRQGGRAGFGRAEIAPAAVIPAERGKSVI